MLAILTTNRVTDIDSESAVVLKGIRTVSQFRDSYVINFETLKDYSNAILLLHPKQITQKNEKLSEIIVPKQYLLAIML